MDAHLETIIRHNIVPSLSIPEAEAEAATSMIAALSQENGSLSGSSELCKPLHWVSGHHLGGSQFNSAAGFAASGGEATNLGSKAIQWQRPETDTNKRPRFNKSKNSFNSEHRQIQAQHHVRIHLKLQQLLPPRRKSSSRHRRYVHNLPPLPFSSNYNSPHTTIQAPGVSACTPQPPSSLQAQNSSSSQPEKPKAPRA